MNFMFSQKDFMVDFSHNVNH